MGGGAGVERDHVSADGLVTVAPSAEAGDYDLRARVRGVTGSAILRVLPRPSGKLVFVSSITGQSRIYVKDFANDDDAVELALDMPAVFGIAADQAGGRIFFSGGTLPNVDIYAVDIDGSNLVNLTNSPASSNQGPTIHPVSGDIYFTRRVSNVSQVFRMTQNGSEVTQVSTGTQSKTNPAISPNGERIAWGELYQPGFNNEIVIAQIDGSNPERFTDNPGGDGPVVWVSDTRLVWSWLGPGASPDLFSSMVPSPNDPVNLTNDDATDSSPSAGCSATTFIFTSMRNESSRLFQFDVASSLVVKFTLPTAYPITLARRVCS